MNTAHELLDRFHDGLASPAERARFESALALSPALAGELELQRAIDRRLGALFGLPAELHAARTRGPARAGTWLQAVLATAAALLLFLWCWRTPPAVAPATASGASWQSHYLACSLAEPAAAVACTSWSSAPAAPTLDACARQEYGATLELDLACTALRLPESALAGAQTWWVRCGQERSLVLLGPAGSTPRIALAPGSGLCLRVRELDGLLLQELAPVGQGGALEHLRVRAAR